MNHNCNYYSHIKRHEYLKLNDELLLIHKRDISVNISKLIIQTLLCY